MSGWCHGFTLLRVVVSFSYGSELEAVVCIQVYYTALYRPHGSTDIKSKTMHKITLCIICNALYTTGQSAVAHWTLGSHSLGIFHDAALQVSCQSFCLIRPLTSLCRCLPTLVDLHLRLPELSWEQTDTRHTRRHAHTAHHNMCSASIYHHHHRLFRRQTVCVQYLLQTRKYIYWSLLYAPAVVILLWCCYGWCSVC